MISADVRLSVGRTQQLPMRDAPPYVVGEVRLCGSAASGTIDAVETSQ